ncbi:hypothetical protein ACC754_44210, partial [Rhizobium johnstonii]
QLVFDPALWRFVPQLKAQVPVNLIGSNDVWAMDLVHDQLATGKKLRVLTVIDTFSSYVPVLDPRHSYRGEDVVQNLE